jgi:hypothetical protein
VCVCVCLRQRREGSRLAPGLRRSCEPWPTRPSCRPTTRPHAGKPVPAPKKPAAAASRAAPAAGGAPAITIVSFKNTASGVAAAEAALNAPARALDTTHDAVLLKPVISGDRATWAFLHGALMMGAFGLLLPVGALLARHRWMFGRDPRTVRGREGALKGTGGARGRAPPAAAPLAAQLPVAPRASSSP